MPNRVTSEQTINGAFGELQITNLTTIDVDGNPKRNNALVLLNTQSVEARVTVERRDLKLSGSRRTVYKPMGSAGEGSFTIFRVTSEFINLGVDALSPGNRLGTLGGDRSNTPRLTLVVSLKDPEIVDNQEEEITLTGVKIWEIPFGWSVDDLVQQTITFTFEEMYMSRKQLIA